MTHHFPIYRNGTLIATVTPQGENQEGIMGIDVLTMTFTQNEYTEFLKGDTVIYNGQTYTLKNPSDWIQGNKWHYSLQFLAPPYKLADIQMLGLDENNELNEYECYFTGTAQAAVDFIILNANRIDPGYTRGTVDSTDTQTFDFTGDNCSTALTKLSDVYKTEFWITNKVIHLTKKGADSGLSFRRGKGMGLTALERKALDTKVVTRLRVYGSKQNLPTTYPGQSKRLRMPNNQLYIQDPDKVAKYGLIEDTKIFEDIFPQRIGTVMAVTNAFTFSDSSLDFNIKEQLIPGTSAKVKFITGQLAGWQFEIRENGYNHSTKTITINPNKDETSIEVPSETGLKPAVGDQYILIDIIMPQSYIIAEEIRLKQKAEEAYALTCDPRVQYVAPTDRRYLRDNDILPRLGDYVNINEPAAGIDKDIRIISKRTNIQDPYDITIELSDTASVANMVRQMINEKDTQKAINRAKLTDVARQRMNWRTTAELTTMLDTLRAEMLLIMNEGGNYSTTIVYSTNGNTFQSSAGTVTHDEYVENGGSWNVVPLTVSLPENAPYYFYIRANKSDQSATMVYSMTKIGVNDEPGFYHFPFGILSSQFSGQRLFTSERGFTQITGGNIKTGKIVSNDGLTWFDLDLGEFRGKFTFTNGEDVEETLQGVSSKIGDLPAGQTIIEGGKINTQLLETQSLIARQVETSGPNYVTLNKDDDNQLKFRHANGVVGIQIGIIDGNLKLVFFNTNGLKVWEGGQAGIVYVNTIPESWSERVYRSILQTSEYPLSEATKSQIANSSALRNGTCVSEDGTYMGVNTGTTFYEYSAGSNQQTPVNNQYNGVHTSQVKDVANFIPDGYYLRQGYLTETQQSDTTFTFQAIYFKDGNILGLVDITAPKSTINVCSF